MLIIEKIPLGTARRINITADNINICIVGYFYIKDLYINFDFGEGGNIYLKDFYTNIVNKYLIKNNSKLEVTLFGRRKISFHFMNYGIREEFGNYYWNYHYHKDNLRGNFYSLTIEVINYVLFYHQNFLKRRKIDA